MNVLIVDNLTKTMPDLKRSLSKYQYDLINYKTINLKLLKRYDKIILSGGHAFSVLHPNKKYKKELELIKNIKIPILGICLGFQLICKAYGANISYLKKYEKGILQIDKTSQDDILKGLPRRFSVFENHKIIVKNVKKNLIPLAISKDGVEMVRHLNKPIYGVQFHPEKFVRKNLGRKILSNFLNYP